MRNQAALDVLNSLKIFETNGGEDPYILVEDSQETRDKLLAVGITENQIVQVSDGQYFCILALSANNQLCDDYVNGEFV